jgi:hypothetical protein
VLGEVYTVLDEDIWRLIGQVTVKVKGLLDGRFKKMKGGLGASTTIANNPGMMTSREGDRNLNRSLLAGENAAKASSPKNQTMMGFQKGMAGQKSAVNIAP